MKTSKVAIFHHNVMSTIFEVKVIQVLDNIAERTIIWTFIASEGSDVMVLWIVTCYSISYEYRLQLLTKKCSSPLWLPQTDVPEQMKCLQESCTNKPYFVANKPCNRNISILVSRHLFCSTIIAFHGPPKLVFLLCLSRANNHHLHRKWL